MFHDLEDPDGDYFPNPPKRPDVLIPSGSETKGLPEDPDSKPRPTHPAEIKNDGQKKLKWKRVERRIYSPFWRAMHNLIAHPMLAIYRPLGEYLHEFTARKMYEPRGDLPPIITNND